MKQNQSIKFEKCFVKCLISLTRASVVLNVCFQASLIYKGPHFGLLDDLSKVACGNKTCFVEFQMTFWLALPSWFRKLSFITMTTA